MEKKNRYHWAFLVGPKVEAATEVPGTRYHVKNRPLEGWLYEEVKLRNVRNTSNLLVRVVVAKVEDEARLTKLLRGVPIEQDDPGWRCRDWMASALESLKLERGVVGTSVLDWETIEGAARNFAGEKTRAGRYRDSSLTQLPKPTWNMLKNRETTS